MTEIVTRGRRHEVRCRHVDCSPHGDRSVLVLSTGSHTDALAIAAGHRRAHEIDAQQAAGRPAGSPPRGRPAVTLQDEQSPIHTLMTPGRPATVQTLSAPRRLR